MQFVDNRETESDRNGFTIGIISGFPLRGCGDDADGFVIQVFADTSEYLDIVHFTVGPDRELENHSALGAVRFRRFGIVEPAVDPL